MKKYILLILTVLTGIITVNAQATTVTPEINAGDTAWMIVAVALVLFMSIPGLSLFYGGLVRPKKCIKCFYAGICTGWCDQYRMGL